MIIALLVSAVLGMAAFLFQYWVGVSMWVAYAGAAVFGLSVVGMLIYGTVKK